jgi:hypothetical protein
MSSAKLRYALKCLIGLLLALWPVHVGAQQANLDGYLTADQVQAAYTAQGYQIERTLQWGTASTWSRVTALVVSDRPGTERAHGRVVMVLIFPNQASAIGNRELAAEQDDRRGDGPPPAGHGPHLMDGYGYSTWFENAAVVEASGDSATASDSTVDIDLLGPLAGLQENA